MRFISPLLRVGTLCLLAGQQVEAAITLDLTSTDSIKKAASTVAYDLMSIYTGNRTGDVPGNLPDPYYWWEAGAMFGTMINYWYYTKDTTYNDVVMQALLHQAGDDNDYMPLNQTKTLGNDDQGFWGMAAMTAAETKFPDPPRGKAGWLALAQGVFNTQAPRWDMTACGGGFRWQIFSFNAGYTYKNSISNGVFFNLGARLALYTGNQTYADLAERTWNWMEGVGYISPKYEVFDGAGIDQNCSSINRDRWTYNAGIYLLGAAAMYNHTNGSAIWESRVTGMLNGTNSLFIDNVMYEGCEAKICNVDQRSFKAYLTRWMAATVKLAPFTHSIIMERISASANAATKTCTGGARGTSCGLKWTTGAFDGSTGVGEQMAALEAIQSNLVDSAVGWVSAVKGTGTSVGDVNAGHDVNADSPVIDKPITVGDRVGAGIFTALIMAGVVGGSITMVLP